MNKAPPRKQLIVRVPADVFDALGAFSDATGTSRNDFVVGVLTESLPTLKRLTEAVLAARAGVTAPVLRNVSAALTGALAEAQRGVAEVQGQLDLSTASPGRKKRTPTPKRGTRSGRGRVSPRGRA